MSHTEAATEVRSLRETQDERMNRLRELVRANPAKPGTWFKNQLRSVYGHAVGNNDLTAVMREVRAEIDAERIANGETPKFQVGDTGPLGGVQDNLRSFARQMQGAGIRLLEITADGHLRVEMFTKL